MSVHTKPIPPRPQPKRTYAPDAMTVDEAENDLLAEIDQDALANAAATADMNVRALMGVANTGRVSGRMGSWS